MGEVRLSLAWAALLAFACAREVRPVKSAASHGDQGVASTGGEACELPAPMEMPAPEKRAEKAPSGPPAPALLPVVRRHEELTPFYDGLDELRARVRKEHVRVYWLGDSHTAADFMTHRVRLHLSSMTRDGGPGFVRLGLKDYRHGAVRFSDAGKWRRAPILPSQRTRVLDGIFGYGGIRTLPASTASVTAELRQPTEAPFTWTLTYRLPPGAKLEVHAGERIFHLTREQGASKEPEVTIAHAAAQSPGSTEEDAHLSHEIPDVAAGDILSRTFWLRGDESFSVHHYGGDPQVLGAFGEYEEPGVVLDTVGINGARTATVLAWEPEQFVDQIRAREPDLLVLAFGTNEVFDNTNVDHYVDHTVKVVELAREARPNLPCWIVGPPDSAAMDGGSKERVALVTAAQEEAARRLHCAFTSAYELMGGHGSFSAWARQRPALARSDRIHLTIAGYEALGDLLGKALVGAPKRAPPSEEEREPFVPPLEVPAHAEVPAHGEAH